MIFLRDALGTDEIEMISDAKEPSGDRVEVLVGDTSRKQTVDVRRSLRAGEFAIAVRDGKLVICGATEQDTADAVEYFCKNYADVVKGGVFAAENEYTRRVEYAVKTAAIGGVDLSDYVIVFPKGDVISEHEAKMTADTLAAVTGIPLEVRDAASKTDRPTISVVRDPDFEYGKWSLSCADGDLTVRFGGIWAANDFCDYLANECVAGDRFEIDVGTEFVRSGGIASEGENFVYVGDKSDASECPVKRIAINGVDIGKFTVVCDRQSEVEFYAAREFVKYIEYAVGVTLKIAPDTDVKVGHEIVVGHTSRGLISEAENLADEKTVAAVRSGDLILCGGGRRGTLYAVYDFLERHIGCRFFASDCEVIRRADNIDIPDGMLELRGSDMVYRDVYAFDTLFGSFAAKLKINGYYRRSFSSEQGGAVSFAGGDQAFVHTITRIFRIGDDFESSQPCLSDPENLKKAITAVRDHLKEYPSAQIVSLTQNDNNNRCRCAECARIDREEGSGAGTLMRFVNAVADGIKDDFPNVRILTLAYMYSAKPPKTAPRDNVIIELCAYDYCAAHPYGSCAENEEFAEYLEGWSALTDNIFVWDYNVDYSKPSDEMPFMNFDALYDNFALYRQNGVIGFFGEAQGGARSYEFGELRSYLIAHLMWDKDITREEYETMIDEFIDAYYGARSKAIRRYFDFFRAVSDAASHFDLYAQPTRLTDADAFSEASDEFGIWFDKLPSPSDPAYVGEHISRLRRGFDTMCDYFENY